ncbi:PilX N-terminal domain-containing pilus assembly protein [Halomonas sp. THAF12]|uniref:PilX N-terminal domain-containing pilus assembly protein n=1 Tax=Halomonas sp. B23F22_10 TaxID=3459515 RepID=UPI00373F59A1
MKKQQGAALLVVLSVLVVSLMLALSSMQSSLMDERLAGNYKASTEAQMGAERAAAIGLDNFDEESHLETVDDVDDISAMEWSDFLSGDGVFDDSLGGADNACSGNVECFYRFVSDASGDYVVAYGGVVDDGGELLSARSAVLRVDFGGGSVFALYGLLAGDDVRINGASVFDGSAHANGKVVVNGAYVQWDEDASVTDEGDGVEVGIPEVDFAPYLEGEYDVVTLDVKEGRGGKANSCNFDYAGDLEGKVFYCDGDMTMSSSGFHNAILLAEGEVSQNGAVSTGESGVSTAVLAKGDIVFNGASVVYGWFLSGGDVRQNGSSVLNGSIVAHGTIRRNGGMMYHHLDGDVNVSSESGGKRILSWR